MVNAVPGNLPAIVADPVSLRRIFDNLSVGQRNGFLIDCWPNQSLRVIVGPRQDDFPNVLEADVWQHIVVVMGKGRLEVYLNGKKLQKR